MAPQKVSPVNFLLLAELVVVVIVASAFLFYWNRLLGSLLAAFIRLFTWRRNTAYISIGSLQISPLAGRISFRDVEYHSSNLSIRALHGHITFRYWIFRVRQEVDTQSEKPKQNRLPCRINVYAEGVECFVFNRTPAYDAIVERMKKHEKESANDSDETLAKRKSDNEDGAGLGARLRRVAKSGTSGASQTNETTSTSDSAPKVKIDSHALPLQPKPVKTPSLPGVNWFREALPVEMHLINGSLILGSDSTPSIVIGSFEKADGTIEISDSRSVCDDYKLSANLSFEQSSVLLRTNVDYSGPILAHGKKLYEELYKREPTITKQPPSVLSAFFGFHALVKRFPFIKNPKFSSPPVAGLPTDRPWRGLARYRVNDNTPKVPRREEREYAKVTTLVKADLLEFTYYADTPGLVPHPSEVSFVDPSDEFGNVDLPPEYGVDIVVHNGIVNYGPWADRQRDALQKTFAPSIFFDSEPKPRLKPGDTRIHSNMIVNVEFADRTTLRIPSREASKDWEHEHRSQEETRTYGWLDVVVGSNSSVTYTQSQFATKRGYDAMLVLHLDMLAISSSVNYLTFLEAKTCKLSMTMPTPLSWNARRDWGLDITMDVPQISLLRDHVQLISDLAKDWSSGATGDFHHFVPNHYNFRVTLLNYGVHLCLNDFNIIDSPLSRDQNAFMDITGPRLESYVSVAATQYRPDLSTIPFSANLQDAVVALNLPSWDTYRSFADQASLEVGKIGNVSAKGSYTYYSNPHPDHQESLTLHLEGKRVAFKMFGWALRRLFNTKDNYFGSFTQFSTSAEFLERFDHDPKSVGDPIEQKYRPGGSDAFAVQVTMNVEESLILLPDRIHGSQGGLAMPVPQLQMSLKSVAHFMELSLDAMPTYIVAVDSMEGSYNLGLAPPIKTQEAIFIEGLELRANRLFGPQPRAETYLCLWELVAPRMTAFLSPNFLSVIQSSVAAVIYTFTDTENAPAKFYIPQTPPDVTFFKLSIDEINATLFAGDHAASLRLAEGVNLDTSSLATRSFASAAGLIIPSIVFTLLDLASDSRWVPNGVLSSSLTLDTFNAPIGWQEKADAQQRFLEAQDRPTQRVWYMYRQGSDESLGHYADMLYLPVPWAIEPEDHEVDSLISGEEVPSNRTDVSHANPSSQSDEGGHAPKLTRTPLRKRSKSIAVPKDFIRRSSSGESVTSSGTSSGTSSSSSDAAIAGPDMAAALADRLKLFRSVQVELPQYEQPLHGDEAPQTSHKADTVPEGTLVKLNIGRLDGAAGLDTVRAAANLFNYIQSLTPPLEVQLDQLLIHHTDVVNDQGTPKSPTMIAVNAYEVRLNIASKTGTDEVTSINCDLRGINGNVALRPGSDGRSKAVDASLGSRSATISVIAPKLDRDGLSLGGIEGVPHGNDLAVMLIQSNDLHIAVVQDAEQQSGIKAGSIEVKAVSAAANSFIHLFRAWSQVATDIKALESQTPSQLNLIYRIIEQAEDAHVTTTAPSFIFEGAYQLHAKDQRSIRRDPGWLMIARLRHYLRKTKIEETLRKILAPPAEIAMWIVQEMARLEDSFCGDEALITAQPFFQKAAASNGDHTQPIDGQKESRGWSMFVMVENIALHHYGRLLRSAPVTTSTLSLKSASTGAQKSAARHNDTTVDHVRILVAAREIRAELQDSILPAIQELLTLAETPDRTNTDAAILQPDTGHPGSSLLVVDVELQEIQLSFLAGGLRLRFAASNLQQAIARKSSRSEQEGENVGRAGSHDSVFGTCEQIELALLQPKDEDGLATLSPDRVVAFLRTSELRFKVEDRSLGVKDRPTRTKVIFGVGSIEFDSRPQLRAFLAFAREWQKRHLGVYRSLINNIRDLVTEKKAHNVPESADPAEVEMDLTVGSASLQVRAAKAVWLRWDVGKIYVSRHASKGTVEFGVRLAPQVVGAYTTLKRTKDKDASSIRLPSLTAIGSHREKDGRPHVSSTVDLGFFVGVLKPAVLDRLLSLHQRLGADVMHIVDEYRDLVRKELAKTRPKAAPHAPTSPSSECTHTPSPASGLLMDVRISVSGLRVGLRADDVASTLLFEAIALRGALSNTSTPHAAMLWRAKADHLGMSLGHLDSTEISDDTEPMRKHRSAYMLLDVDARETPGQQKGESQLKISLNRVHTVMHVAALSELTDLVRTWQSDLHILRDNRADEVAEVKTTTSRLLKKLDSGDKGLQPAESWFAKRLFTVQVLGFGVAIPLDEGSAIDMHRKDRRTVPALLFSIRVVSFQNRRNETARFKVQRLSLQFLESFDQSAPEHFQGDYHPSTNRMLLPSLDSEAQMSSSPDVWCLSAHSVASDFKLSLAPSMVSGVYKLMDLYENGKDRLVELEKHYRAEMAKTETIDSVHAKYGDRLPTSPARPHQQIVLRMSYTFQSGIVELHRSSDKDSFDLGSANRTRSAWHDTFVLPSISLWTDYEGPKDHPQDGGSDDVAGLLILNAAVHESRNTLRPTILPFFVDLVNKIEARQSAKPRRAAMKEAEHKAQQVASAVSEQTLQVIAPAPDSIVRIRVTLRIDKSELRLSCAPDSNAYVDLKWESGGFMASCALGNSMEISTVAGSISGVTASLSNEFADQGRSCVEAGARDMAFSVTLCPGRLGVQHGLSVVLDTQLSGQFRLDAFSAWLIFTSVWVDNAPSLDVPLRAAIPEATSASHTNPASPSEKRDIPSFEEQSSAPTRPKTAVAALVRFRSIVLDTNIGVSEAKLEITPVTLQTISNGEKTEVDLRIGKTEVTAKGDISGSLRSDKLVFNTVRRSSRALEETQSTVLAMSIDAGDLRGNLFLGKVNIFRFHLEPAFVSLADDWKDFQGDHTVQSQVTLAFGVKAGNLSGVLRLLSIPRFLGNLYSILDMVDSQQRIAVQRSEIFKTSRTRKKENRSSVSAAILESARRASTTSAAPIRTAQTMRFDLAGIDVGVFNEDHESGGHIADFYRFVVGKVEADLDRRTSKDDIPIRDLGLLISLVHWDYSDGARVAAKEKASMDPEELIELAWRQGHKSVVSLPSMTMTMKSKELAEPYVLDFDFDLVWGETDGDIGILPNFFEQAISAFRKLVKGIKEQEVARYRRGDPSLSPKNPKKNLVEDELLNLGPVLEYRPRNPTWADDPPIPKLKQLGESTREAATFIPRIKSATKELPVLSHKFVTLPLEEGMDILLKLYEKQLPERSGCR